MSKDQYLIEKNGNKYEVIIGLEVHAQVLSESKLFSTSATKFGSEPNTQVSLVDAAFPGMLPVINEFCVRQAVKTGIGLNAKINKNFVEVAIIPYTFENTNFKQLKINDKVNIEYDILGKYIAKIIAKPTIRLVLLHSG